MIGWIDPGVVVAGFVVGVLVGATGIGSGSLMAPLLIFVFGRSPLIAVGSDLAYSAITKIVGAAQHLRLGTVDRRLAVLLAIGSVPAGLAGVAVTAVLEQRSLQLANGLTAQLLGAVLLLVAAVVLLDPIVGGRWRSRAPLAAPALIALGALVGLLVGLTSLGSGALLAPILVLTTQLPYRRVVGTDIAHAALLTTAAATVHVAAGHIDVPLVASLLAGSVPGVVIGSRMMVRLPQPILRATLGAVLAISGLRLVI
jgi:uncharacterized membrane protein YfcA